MSAVHTAAGIAPGEIIGTGFGATNRAAVLACALISALAGCGGLDTRGAAAGADIGLLAIGNNLADEACHAESASLADDVVPGASRKLLVYCGDWEWPSARVFALATADQTEALTHEGGEWRSLLAERAICAATPTRSEIDGGVEADLFDCQLRNGGWPYVALRTSVNGTVYLADGIPAALPPVERLVAELSGIGEPSTPSEAQRFLIERLNEQARYGAADLAAYYRWMTLGQHYNSVQAFSKAERQYRNALWLQERVLGAGNSQTTDALMHVALELSNTEQLQNAETLFEEVKVRLDPEANRGQYARFLGYYAIHAANTGNLELAAERARTATELRRQTAAAEAARFGSASAVRLGPGDVLSLENSGVPDVEAAHSLYIEAAALQRMGRNDDAGIRLQEAQRILASAPAAPPLWEPRLDELASDLEASRGNLPVAVEVQQGAVAKFEVRAPGERPTAMSRLEMGRLLLAQGRVDEALTQYRAAVELAGQRANYFRPEQLSPYFDALFDRARAVPSERAALDAEFFVAAQLVQSAIAAEDISRTIARFAESDDQVGQLLGELQRTEYERLEVQRRYQGELARVLEPGHAERLDVQLGELERIDLKLEDLSRQVQAISPRYRQLVGIADLDVARVSAALNPGEGLLQVLVGPEHSYVAFVDSAGIVAYTAQVSVADLVEDIGALRADILSRGVSVVSASPVPSDVTETMHELYLALLGPVSDRLQGVSHLLFVPTGPLLSLPPGLLVTGRPDSQNGVTSRQQVDWLARKTSISVVPSVQSLVYLRTLASRPSAPRSLAGFGGFENRCTPLMEETALSLRFCQVPGDLRYCLLELPGTGREVQEVAGSIAPGDSTLLLGPNFSEARIKALPLDEYRVIYFASHAILPDEIECLSKPSIATTAPRDEQGREDGFLTSDEILELELNADLVVLSACNTGAPDRAGGESLSGLARAFFFAGARSLLVSHWSVDDAATADLMAEVFGSLARGEAATLAEALRHAQQRMILDQSNEAWSDPYFWGAFTLVGDGAATLEGVGSARILSLQHDGAFEDDRAGFGIVDDRNELFDAAAAAVPETLHLRLGRADE
jgi:CHAT domain-containing protein